MMHKAERPSNYFFSNSFTYYQAEQIKKGVICVQILLEIHRRFHFQGTSVRRHFNVMRLQGNDVVCVL